MSSSFQRQPFSNQEVAPNFHGGENGEELGEKGDGDEDGHDDEQDAIFMVRDEESVDADDEGEDAEVDHEVGSEDEPVTPEAQLVQVVELHEDNGEEDEDGGGDGEENVAQIDELLVLAGPGLPGAQTHLTGPSHRDASR